MSEAIPPSNLEPAYNPLLPEAEVYAGPVRACVAMVMLRTGVAPLGRYPDVLHVQAFARHDPAECPPDLDTVLGVAASFSDASRTVRYVGIPVVDPRAVSAEAVRHWRDLLAGRSNVSADFRPPEPEDLMQVLTDPQARWTVKLDIPGESLGVPEQPFQPCLVAGLDGDTLLVHSPGSEHLKAEAFQAISIDEALGLGVPSSRRHAGLLAVRSRVVLARGPAN